MKIGIVGGGQLGQMLAQAGQKLGHSFKFLVPPGECCVEGLGEVIRNDFLDQNALSQFARDVDVFTFEWENVPQATLEALSHFAPMRPAPSCAQVAKDRIQEKKFFQAAGFSVQKFAPVSCHGDLAPALQHVGMPAMLKTRGQGYDGKGQRRITEKSQAADAYKELGSVACILEAFVPFDFEISVIAVRAKQNASPTSNSVPGVTTLFYPPCRNQHINGVLHQTTVPAEGVSPTVLQQAQSAIQNMLETMDYEGVLCVEFFVLNTPDGQQLIANEMAPRVHNSGHWSIEGAATSQFTNHIQAITRQELGSTNLQAKSVMINLVGAISSALVARKNLNEHAWQGAPSDSVLEPIENVNVHIYGKSPRAGRKLGHITAVGENAQRLAELAFNGH
ncbi:MAG: 5-(carboxyamino)imidazole ribonucleotide synthase [Phycisphaerales bacterium]|nr:5-(carboxyamino)imidazole ribonucleotide synthase [Phycisphaerales bacterium]